MMTTVWLSTVVIEINNCQVNVDCYGTSNEKIWLIQSGSIWGITKVVESWSIGTHRCTQCDRAISDHEFNARDGVCRRCWGQVDIPEDDSYWMHPGRTR